MNYRCVQCGVGLWFPLEGEGELKCFQCGFGYIFSKNYLKYDFGSLLIKHFKKQYLLNQVLNNNGLLSYHFLKDGSVSLSSREDVLNFRRYLLSQVAYGKILDVGCGILEVPGYLDFEKKDKFEFYGIDPIDNQSFRGVRITGCAEFMPFPNGIFDAIVFATSLDHVCSLKHVIEETSRVLSRGGKAIVWMSDRSLSLVEKVKNQEERWMNLLRLIFGFKMDKLINCSKGNVQIGKFIIYQNGRVLYIPKGAVDPFHSYLETPKKIISRMRKANLVLSNMQTHHKNAVFLSFQKL